MCSETACSRTKEEETIKRPYNYEASWQAFCHSNDTCANGFAKMFNRSTFAIAIEIQLMNLFRWDGGRSAHRAGQDACLRSRRTTRDLLYPIYSLHIRTKVGGDVHIRMYAFD